MKIQQFKNYALDRKQQQKSKGGDKRHPTQVRMVLPVFFKLNG